MMFAWSGRNRHSLVLKYLSAQPAPIAIVILPQMGSIFSQHLLMVMFLGGTWKILVRNNMP